jgi:biotin transport system substrate-specific component
VNRTSSSSAGTRELVFSWCDSLSITGKITLALGMALVTGLLAQVRVPLPWTPVPVTGQTFAVLLAGLLLGRRWGGLSQAFYVVLGVAGVPWFAGWSGGSAVLVGPTGGYLIGFVLAALFVGRYSDTCLRGRKFVHLFALLFFANFALIHLPGLVNLRMWYALAGGSETSFRTLFLAGTLPFVLGDILKVGAAASIGAAMAPARI